ncbi:MAG: hypothetical protein OXU98_00175, partial [Gammaproteobacteria bacterium]|nr:hypothetical protein [Gammaproteobacteria bacterium]
SRPEVEDFTRAINDTDGAPGTDGAAGAAGAAGADGTDVTDGAADTRLLQGWRRQLIGEEILTRVL